MQSVSRLALTFVLLTGCIPQGGGDGSGGRGGGSGGNSSASGGTSARGGSAGSSSSATTSSGGSAGTGEGGSGGASTTPGSGGAAGNTLSAQGGQGGGWAGAGGDGRGGSGGSAMADAGPGSGGRGGAGGVSAPGGASGGGGGNGGSAGAAGNAGSTARGGGGSGGGTARGGSGGGGNANGGMMGSGGGGGSTASTAPTACSFPSAWTPGGATYTTYTLPNDTTACGYNRASTDNIKNIANATYFAAIPGNSSSDFNTSNRCGACVQIGSAIITIVDECPFPGNSPCQANPTGHLDLSQAAASAGGVKGDPSLHNQNQWKFVACPINGNVIVRLKTGNSNEMFIENLILPLSAVTCGGQTGSRTSYGAWHFNSNIPGASCDLTDIAGRKITVTAGSTQGQDVDTKVQFPKCQ